MRALLTGWLLLFALGPRSLTAQGTALLRERILLAEDRRAQSGADLILLEKSLHYPDSTVALQAIRALGRLERPAVAGALIPLLGHSSSRIRAQAAEALAQAAQGFRRDSSPAHRGNDWPAIVAALTARVPVEHEPHVVASLALSLGRLPYFSAEEIQSAAASLLALLDAAADDPEAIRGAARGIETLVRATGRRVPLDSVAARRLAALTAGLDEPARRHALGALLLGQLAGPAVIVPLLHSPDEQTRRLAVSGMTRLSSGAERDRLLEGALVDRSPMVRVEALRVEVRLNGAAACPALRGAAVDSVLVVMLTALDLLTACSGDTASVRLLTEAVVPIPGSSWHASAHARVSLARAAPLLARRILTDRPPEAGWESRMYAARAATFLRDTLALLHFAADSVPNVREAAIAGLVTLGGRGFDSVYRAALRSRDYQLLLGAATALGGTADRAAAVVDLLASLERVTRERRETSRDARIALLTRLHELGSPALGPRILPYLGDFDPAVAESAAVMVSGWTGQMRQAAPLLLPIVPVRMAEVMALRGKKFHFTMTTGAEFDVALYSDEAPLTVARLARLVRHRYFDGLTLHRDVPNFVLQGGSPGANEYTGDGPFMRDELGPRSHARGTLGVSTRGRDTGDGQLFINLVDNPRLDFEYTVWGRVVSGWDVVEALREGARLRRVEIRPR